MDEECFTPPFSCNLSQVGYCFLIKLTAFFSRKKKKIYIYIYSGLFLIFFYQVIIKLGHIHPFFFFFTQCLSILQALLYEVLIVFFFFSTIRHYIYFDDLIYTLFITDGYNALGFSQSKFY